jgi:ATPase subunit of ABC transporter with duplicated ATPase domains
VSHDEHLITSVCDSLLVVDGGKVYEFQGDFDAYREQQLASVPTRR